MGPGGSIYCSSFITIGQRWVPNYLGVGWWVRVRDVQYFGDVLSILLATEASDIQSGNPRTDPPGASRRRGRPPWRPADSGPIIWMTRSPGERSWKWGRSWRGRRRGSKIQRFLASSFCSWCWCMRISSRFCTASLLYSNFFDFIRNFQSFASASCSCFVVFNSNR